MKVGIATDHHGIEIKQELTNYLNELGYTVVNYGTDTEGLAGFHSISWVSCKDMGHYGGTDITTFEPKEESIKEEHLDADLVAKINNNYHTIIQDGVIIREDINTFEFDINERTCKKTQIRKL